MIRSFILAVLLAILPVPAFARQLTLIEIMRVFARDRVTVNFRPGRLGQKLVEGNVVRTTSGAGATIRMDFNLGTIKIGSRSTFRITNLTFQNAGAQSVFQVSRYIKASIRAPLSGSTRTLFLLPTGRVLLTGTTVELVGDEEKSTAIVSAGEIEMYGQGEFEDAFVSAPAGSGAIVEQGKAPVGPISIDRNLLTDFTVERSVLGYKVDGHTSPLNEVIVNGKPVLVDSQGRYSAKFRRIEGNALRVVVKLGETQRTYVEPRRVLR